jgi:hypothetical protein
VIICASKNPKDWWELREDHAEIDHVVKSQICFAGPKKMTDGSTVNCMCLPVAAAVGIVDMVDCRPITREDMYAAYCCDKEDGSDFDGEVDGYAWLLENPREIEPIAVKGQLRPWPWQGPEPVLAPGWHKARFAWDEEA